MEHRSMRSVLHLCGSLCGVWCEKFAYFLLILANQEAIVKNQWAAWKSTGIRATDN